MYPDWITDFGAPTVDDRIINAFELTVDPPPPPPRQLTLLVEPGNGTRSMSDRGNAVAAILRKTHNTTALFLNAILNNDPQKIDIESLRVDLKNLLENHRSALEYVAHYMAEKCVPIPRPKDVQFPVAKPSDDPIGFSQKLNKWFPGLSSSHPALVTYLIGMQPFNSDAWLHRLSEWTNYHKHHSLPVWELATFDSLIIHVGEDGLRVGELGFQSIELTPTGKIVFKIGNEVPAELGGPAKIDLSSTNFAVCDPRIIIERQSLDLYRLRGEHHSIAHEVWSISKNVFRAIHTICYHLSKP